MALPIAGRIWAEKSSLDVGENMRYEDDTDS